MGTVENINIRILIEGDKSRPITMTIEMISENDLFFNYFSKIDESIYFQLKQEQQLNIEYSNLLNSIIKIISSCAANPQ